MATDAAISAALTAATSLAITPGQIVDLIRRAMVAGVVDSDGRLVVGTSSRGTSITFSIADAIEIDRYYRSIDPAVGGMVAAPGEMVSG